MVEVKVRQKVELSVIWFSHYQAILFKSDNKQIKNRQNFQISLIFFWDVVHDETWKNANYLVLKKGQEAAEIKTLDAYF